MESFARWINSELDKRGWSRSEAARRGEISDSMFSKVISGYANPGLNFCRGVSRAFAVPLEDVFRLAGILPHRLLGHDQIRQRRIVYEVNPEERVLVLWRGLAVEEQQAILVLLERLQPKVEPRIIGDAPEDDANRA